MSFIPRDNDKSFAVKMILWIFIILGLQFLVIETTQKISIDTETCNSIDSADSAND